MSVRSIPTLLTAALTLALVSGSAHARPPTADERPTLEQLYERAKQDRAAELERAALEKQDPIGDAIEFYRTQQVPMEEYRQLVDVIVEYTDKKLQPYRQMAVEALQDRFRENMDDPDKQRVRRAIALELLPMMKHSSTKDPEGLRLIEDLLYTWWRGKIRDFGFRAGDKLSTRRRAYKKMKSYLEKGGK